MDAASSAALLGRRDPSELLRLCVVELVGRGAWSLEQVPRGRKTVSVLVQGDRPAALPDELPLMRVDALLRELSPRVDASGARWAGTPEGVPLPVLGGWVRTRWGSRHGFVDSVVSAPMKRTGLMKAVRDRNGVRSYELTEEGTRLSADLDSRLKPLKGRRGRRLVKKDPVAALAVAGALGPAIFLVGDLLEAFEPVALVAQLAFVCAGSGGFVAVGNDGFGDGFDFGFTSDGGGAIGSSGGGAWDGGSSGGGGD